MEVLPDPAPAQRWKVSLGVNCAGFCWGGVEEDRRGMGAVGGRGVRDRCWGAGAQAQVPALGLEFLEDHCYGPHPPCSSGF